MNETLRLSPRDPLPLEPMPVPPEVLPGACREAWWFQWRARSWRTRAMLDDENCQGTLKHRETFACQRVYRFTCDACMRRYLMTVAEVTAVCRKLGLDYPGQSEVKPGILIPETEDEYGPR